MRGKRSKQYRKLMQQYGLHFGFREPYQVLLDAEIILVAARTKMNFASLLSSTLHGEIKPMITQCCMRHLYNAKPKDEIAIAHAKHFERRRCNHQDLEKPLSTLECLSSVIDPSGNKTNKHRYVVACQDIDVHQYLQSIQAVPLVYIVRSVMIMKPMSELTARVTAKEEQAKLASGIRGANNHASAVTKRKAPDATEEDATSDVDQEGTGAPKKKRRKGPKAPNPLSVMKPKKQLAQSNGAPQSTSRTGSTRRKR